MIVLMQSYHSVNIQCRIGYKILLAVLHACGAYVMPPLYSSVDMIILCASMGIFLTQLDFILHSHSHGFLCSPLKFHTI